MDTPDLPHAPSGDEESAASGDVGEFTSEIAVVAPPVVAVVVTRNAGAWLEGALESLGAQDYPDLTVLVLDANSAEDPTARVADVLPTAYVRRLDENPGFAGAANEARGMVEGASFYFLCHDDVVPDPDAIRLMVEEAYRSNAAIVGPKLVDDERPEVLLEVGMAIDRFGTPHSEIVPGELDHEQHDGVRDVFYVSSAAMLVRSDLFAELGGFDPEAFPGSEDLDLCWRARVAGARVMVMPDARVRHRRAAPERDFEDAATHDELERTRLRTTLVSYSALTLLWMVPWTIVHTLVETIVFVVTGKFARAGAIWKAWWWNVRNFRSVRTSRGRAQAMRRVPDRELRALQVAGSSRARRYIATTLKGEAAITALGDTGRAVADRAQNSARQPIAIALVAAVAVFVFGSRGLWFDGIPQVGQFGDWSSVGDLARTFGGGWRETLLGSPTPASPVFALMAGLGSVLLGATGLAETLVVLACVPVGVIGIVRLVRSASGDWVSASAAGLSYALVPVWRNAIANGRLGALVFFALAPFLVRAIVLAAGAQADGDAGPPLVRRHWFRLAILGAFATIWFVPSLLVGIAVAVGFLLAAAVPGGHGDLALARRSVVATGVAGLGAFVVLFPWPLAMMLGGFDAGSLGFGFRSRLDVGEILRMSSGPSSSWVAGGGLVAAGLLVLAIGHGPRLVWGIRAWGFALVGFLGAWLPSRFAPSLPMPPSEMMLTVFALGVCAAVGLGFSAFVEDLRGRHFGWRQGVSLVAFVAIAVASLGFIGDSVTGRWHAPRRDWPRFLAFASNTDEGAYRVLWIGEPSVLPFDPVLEEDLAWVLTVDGAGDVTDSSRAPLTDADGRVSDAIDRVAAGETVHLGRLLAPTSVRYVIVPERVGPRSGHRAAPPVSLVENLDAQLDMGRVTFTDDDVHVFENSEWIPMKAVMTVPLDDAVDVDPERLDFTGLSVVADAAGGDVAGEGSGDDATAGAPPDATATLSWSQAANDGWRLDLDGASSAPTEIFGWSNGWAIAPTTSIGEARITWSDQWMRNLTVAFQGLILVAVILYWRGGSDLVRRRMSRGARPTAESADDPEQRDDVDEHTASAVLGEPGAHRDAVDTIDDAPDRRGDVP